jgi:hypothetical protein
MTINSGIINLVAELPLTLGIIDLMAGLLLIHGCPLI